jgi:hypothetical protein
MSKKERYEMDDRKGNEGIGPEFGVGVSKGPLRSRP